VDPAYPAAPRRVAVNAAKTLLTLAVLQKGPWLYS
jgi:hypothetical protein